MGKKKSVDEDRMWERLESLLEGHNENEAIQEALDDTIHDIKSAEASSINNEGISGQLEFLRKDGWTTAQVLKDLGLNDLKDQLVEPDK